jgi:spoIIIJ-associated protein
VVHLALRGETDLRTESAGVGPGRHVVVYPAGMPSLPDLPPQPPQFRGPGGGHRPPFGRGPGGPPPRRGRR